MGAASMSALDAINSRYGLDTGRPDGLEKRSGDWAIKYGNLSPCYTARLTDILSVRSGYRSRLAGARLAPQALDRSFQQLFIRLQRSPFLPEFACCTVWLHFGLIEFDSCRQ